MPEFLPNSSCDTSGRPPFPNVTWHSGTWPCTMTPSIDQHYTNLQTYYRTGLNYRFWPYYQLLELSIEHCNGCGYPTEDAYSSGHLVLSHLGLAFVLMLRPFFPELVMSTDLLSFEHPSVLLFCFLRVVCPEGDVTFHLASKVYAKELYSIRKFIRSRMHQFILFQNYMVIPLVL